jgi:hypothetical protein
MADVTGFRGFYRVTRGRYVNRLELLEISALRAELDGLALESSKHAEAIPRPALSPFLAYHGNCDRSACSLARQDADAALERWQVRLRAYDAVQAIRGR